MQILECIYANVKLFLKSGLLRKNGDWEYNKGTNRSYWTSGILFQIGAYEYSTAGDLFKYRLSSDKKKLILNGSAQNRPSFSFISALAAARSFC
jgi:hypothetical protein